ncbi:basic salivary proline-rich protein 1-like [Bacillus rossius redtenbacheri]|uniref:basic salivary proline-rich protein 1-like n=1 Tax=Bacillus rossius redtenbacheri TaxID=93214 RepID=UPI002FDDF52F
MKLLAVVLMAVLVLHSAHGYEEKASSPPPKPSGNPPTGTPPGSPPSGTPSGPPPTGKPMKSFIPDDRVSSLASRLQQVLLSEKDVQERFKLCVHVCGSW